MRRILAVAATLTLACPPPTIAAETSDAEVNFVPVDEIVVPIVDSARTTGALHLKLVLDATDAAAAARLTAQLPALRETALVTAIEFARLYASPLTPINAEQLSAQMTQALTPRAEGLAHVLLVEVSARQV